MNSWVMVYLPGDVGDDPLIVGSFATLDACVAAIVSTGAPWNYQACQVYGPAIPPPMGTLAPMTVAVGAWLAICSGISPSGGLRLYGYGTFADKLSAIAWGRTQTSPAAYSYGIVSATP